MLQCPESICGQDNITKAFKLLFFHCGPWKNRQTKIGQNFKKNTHTHTKIKKKKCISCREEKSLVVKTDIVIFLSYFVRESIP